MFFAAIQFPRQSAGHSSCATEGRFHSAVLEQGCCRCCARQLPMVLTVQSSCVHRQGRRHPCFHLQKWRCLRFSHRQSSMTITRRKGCFFGAFCVIFRTPPRGVESRGARIFRALDDEEFFVVEGSLGWRCRQESDSRVTCHV